MDQMPDWVGVIFTVAGALGSIVTAIATFFLWRVTRILANETTRIAAASAQPHVVATIVPNLWARSHMDLNIDNFGNAPAYDIEVIFDPPLENGRHRGNAIKVPFQNVSILNPGQRLFSYINEYEALKDKSFSVTIRWKNKPDSKSIHTSHYPLNMKDHEGTSKLGDDDALVSMAKNIKRIEENFDAAISGKKCININNHKSV